MNVKILGLLFRPVKYLLLMSILLLSCSKIIHKESEYSGIVINQVTGGPYEGAKLIFFERDFLFLRDGTSGGHSEVIQVAYSDNNGEFKMKYDTKEANRYSYYIIVDNSNFRDVIYQYDKNSARYNIQQKNKDVSDIVIEIVL